MSQAETTVELQPRNVYVFGATSFLNDTATEMAYWVLPAFLGTIGAGPATLGIIEGIAESVASLAKLFSGFFADRVSRRKPLVLSGYVVANAVKPLLALVTSAWQVLLIRFADRLAKGVRGAPRDVMLSESVPRDKVGSAFGLLQAMDSAGAIAGPLAAMAILAQFSNQATGLRAVFWAAAIPGALAIAVVTLLLREVPHERGARKKVSIFAGVRELPSAFYFVLFALGLFSLGNSSDMFLVLRAQDAGVPVRHAPLLGLVFNITYTVATWPAGKLSDRAASGSSWWRYAITAAGFIVFAIVYWVFAIAPSARVLYAMMALYGLYYALTQPVMKAIVVDTVPNEMRGSAFGLFYFVTSVAALLASVITGALWKRFGASLPFQFSAALALVSAILLLATPKIPRRA
jgi:MFS family permease